MFHLPNENQSSNSLMSKFNYPIFSYNLTNTVFVMSCITITSCTWAYASAAAYTTAHRFFLMLFMTWTPAIFADWLWFIWHCSRSRSWILFVPVIVILFTLKFLLSWISMMLMSMIVKRSFLITFEGMSSSVLKPKVKNINANTSYLLWGL